MSRFEFLLVLVSIIVALALSELIAGWGRMLRKRSAVTWCWLHIFWMVLAFLTLTEVWWVLWELQGSVEWTYGNFLIVLVAPTIAVLAVETITPTETDLVNVTDLRKFYFGAAPAFFTLGALFELALVGQHLWFFGVRPWIIPIQVVGVLLLGLLAVSRSPKLHGWISVAVLCLFLAMVAVRFRV